MNSIAEDNLMHYGTPRHSGRYPWGSGDNPYQRSGDFLSRIEELKNQGLTETEIAKAMGMSTTQYRAQKSLAKDERRALAVSYTHLDVYKRQMLGQIIENSCG